jgi:threonine dehydratase
MAFHDPPRPPAPADVLAAQDRLRGRVHRTPVLTSRGIDALAGAQLFFKCENFQKVGAFKFRGATHAVLRLEAERASRGVATHSSGNHAAALALAARERGIVARVVMPTNAPGVKRVAVESYGAEIVPCEPTLAAREQTLAAVVERTGAHFVHPYNDPDVIAGQGTAALELVVQAEGLEALVVPVGGGGLASGTALALAAARPGTPLYLAEPARADDAFRSLAAGRILPPENPDTIADGLRTALGSLTFAVLRQHAREVVLVEEEEIAAAMRLVWERMKIVVEASAAVPLAAVLRRRDLFARRRVGVVFSGGNVDLARLPWREDDRS